MVSRGTPTFAFSRKLSEHPASLQAVTEYVMLLRSSATRDGLHSIVSESEVLSVTWAALGAFGIGLT